MTRSLGILLALAIGATSCDGSPPPSRSPTQPTTVANMDCRGFAQPDCYFFATMYWLQPTDNGDLELTMGSPSYVGKNGAILAPNDPGRIFVDRCASLARAFYMITQDPKSSYNVHAVGKKVIEAIPDGSDAVFGHQTAFNILLKEGILQEIVRMVDKDQPPPQIVVPDEVLKDSHVWGYEEDSMVLNGKTVWNGPKAALPFHCCAGRIRVSPMDEGGDPLLALVPKAHQALMDKDRDYATRYRSIIGPLDREAMTLPHTKQGGERCDQLTTEVRTKLKNAGLTDKVEAEAKSIRQ